MELFGDAWARAWGDAVNESDDFRETGQGWKGALLLVADAEEGLSEQRVFLELTEGTCSSARAGLTGDEKQAQFVIRAERANWLAALEGQLDPVYGLMRGRLRLSRGVLSDLLPNADAARALVRAARELPRA